jgi:ABC-2 type transport system ATP-binding protein
MAAAPGETLGAAGSVECRNLVVRYGDLTAVDGVSLRVEAGEIVALLGPNGAGKTSTVETLEGYRKRHSGKISVLGVDPGTDHRILRNRIGVMLQRGGIYPMLSPRRALELFARYYREPEDSEALLTRLDLGAVATTPWRHLSGGEQQRLSLGLALVGRPDVLFLDEPTAGVDPAGRLAIRAVIRERAQRGAAVLLTTHELAEAERLADRVVIVQRGRVIAAGTPAELAATPPELPVVRFGATPGIDVTALGTALGATVIETEPGRYCVEAAATPQGTAALTAWLADRGIPLQDLRTAPTLEEVYLATVDDPGPTDALPDRERRHGRRNRKDGRP